MNHTFSSQAYLKANELMPGGVNSPVRSFKSIGIPPVFIKKASGSKLLDIDKNEYIDYCLSWGVGILGHAHPVVLDAVHSAVENGTSYGAPTLQETEIARLICESTASVQKVRLVNSGTEAVMSAIRLARAYTGRDIVVKFDGCYHGHSDMLLVKAGSGLAGETNTSSDGVPELVANNTVSISFNNITALQEVFERYATNIAAVIVEPVAANMGVVTPQTGFLEFIREITRQYGSLLIFDEVITGFRFCFGGVQKLLGIHPDITTFGKIIGGGFPVGAYGASSEMMSLIAPDGPVYQAGTLSGNPVAVSAGIATLKLLQDEKIYQSIEQKAQVFFEKIRPVTSLGGIQLNTYKNMFTLYFSGSPVYDFESARQADHRAFGKFYTGLLNQGIYLSPSGFEANFLSNAHSENDLEKTSKTIISILETTIESIKNGQSGFHQVISH
jgi:glutamate-1-semialdehyde 2,1-aminomutase